MCIRDRIGTYDPNQEPAVVKVDEEAAKKWIANGAKPTDTVARLFKEAGIVLSLIHIYHRWSRWSYLHFPCREIGTGANAYGTDCRGSVFVYVTEMCIRDSGIALVSIYWLDHKHVFYANFQFPLVFRTYV